MSSHAAPPSSDDEDLHKLLTPDQMFIRSTDTLHHAVIDQTIPAGWGDRPPLLIMPDGEETPNLLKGVIRQGVPPALRCAVWLSNIVQTVHPHQPQSYWHEYRTLSKARDLDGAYNRFLQSMIAGEHGAKDPSCWASVESPTFGRENAIQNDASIPPSGKLALKKVLLALNQVLGLEHAPMLPRLTALLLCVMSESYAFCAVREMAHYANYYIPSHALEHAAWCGAFGLLMKKLHESTYEYLYNRGVLEVDGLKPIFQDLFVGILQPQHVLRIIDSYTLEGCKVIYRFGIALLDLFKNESAAFQMIARTNEFWDALRKWTHDPRFNFEYLVSRAYGTHGRGPSGSFGLLGRVRVFPRRQILVSIIKMEYSRLLEETHESETPPPVQPLGLVVQQAASDADPEKEPATPILAQPVENRRHLAEWLPLSLRLTNLELLYSTNHHGRSLELFYPAVGHAKHTILLCEVLNATNVHTVIGVYASQAWRPSTRVYGDGECFLFRLQPTETAQCWKWTPRIHVLKDEDFEEQNAYNVNNATAILEQFMVSTRTFLSMGGSPDGSSGFRLNDDFTKGESSSAVGFDNEPLVVSNGDSIFDVGLVEVYGLVSPW
jgi:hypothetical protein